MRRSFFLSYGFLFLVSSAAHGQGRIWVLPVTKVDNLGVVIEETTGGYVSSYPYPKNGHYWWANTNDGTSRGWWKFQKDANGALGGGPTFDPSPGFTSDDPPAEPRLYFIRTWIPPAHSSVFSIINVDVLGPDVQDVFSIDPRIPWGGRAGTNWQYIGRNPSNQGAWVATGPGPDNTIVALQNGAGVYSAFNASFPCGNGLSSNGFAVWLRKGDWLYVKWNFDGGVKSIGFSAIEITEANAIPPGLPPISTCGNSVCRGPLDLRCIGNVDPLFGVGASNWWDSMSAEPLAERRSESPLYGVDDWSLAADGYRRPCSTNTPITNGLPPSGAYTAHLPAPHGDVAFQLRYEGFNSMKWDSGQTDPANPLYKDRVFTLNNATASEFGVRSYNKLYLLSMKNGGNNGQLNVQLIYSDNSSQTVGVPLYDWFNNDGDLVSTFAVGQNGNLRNGGAVSGFRRIKGNDDASASMETSGGDGGGAFFSAHPINVDPTKVLSQIKLSIGIANPINVTGANWQDNPRRITASGAFVSYTFHDGEQFSITAGNGGARLQRFGIKSKIDDSTIELYDDINDNCGQQPLTGCDINDNSITGTIGMGGNVVVFAASLSPVGCVFDQAGGGPDGSVDMNDYGLFQLCYTGPSILVDPLKCRCMDVTRDGHVDDVDFSYFKNCATRAGVGPPPPNCDVAP